MSSLNLVFIRLRITLRCRSPNPEITSSPVWLSRVTLKVGSSSANLLMVSEIFCSSPRLLGSIASEYNGSVVFDWAI